VRIDTKHKRIGAFLIMADGCKYESLPHTALDHVLLFATASSDDNKLGTRRTKPTPWRKVPLEKDFPNVTKTEVSASRSHGFSTGSYNEPVEKPTILKLV
jgi:hypothetical protein